MKFAYFLVGSLCLIGYVAGHGSIITPSPRSWSNDIATAGGNSMWFSQGCTIGCDCNENNTDFFDRLCDSTVAPMINDPSELTFNIYLNHSEPGVPKDWTKYHPWRLPGSARPLNPCGLAGGSTKDNDVAGGYGNTTIAGVQGFPGTKLAARVEEPPMWSPGSVVDVAWWIAANHGGGYQYRLCSADEAITEECFQKTPLKFHGDTSTLQWTSGESAVIPATRVSTGVLPKGSTWTKNPIPPCDNVSGGFHGVGCDKPTFTPPKGCNDTCWGYQPCFPGEFYPDPCPGPIKVVEIPVIVDKVEIPADLAPGKYVVGFRWDCEHTPQIWQQCADVLIVR